MTTSSYFFRANGGDNGGFPFVELLPVPLISAKLPRSVIELHNATTGERRHMTGLASGSSLEDASACLRDYLETHYPPESDN